MDLFMMIIYGFIAVVSLFILSFIVFFFITAHKYKRFPNKRKAPKRPNILKRILIDFPRQYWLDVFERDPDHFPLYGLHLICGEQGSGKSICLTEMLLWLKKQYPKLEISTNYNYMNEDSPITHWQDIVFKHNGIYGKIEVIDEIQNWFNSLQSKDFPIEMITEISQQRKQTKIIIGTSQVFQRVAKPIREQVTLLYQPLTIAGCLTIVRVYKPKMDDDAKVTKMKFTKVYFFVHNKEIRESFDTYKKIEKMASEGFAIRDELSSSPVAVNVNNTNRRKGVFNRH